jgi:ribulose bisphosphate carboxylase small subunit
MTSLPRRSPRLAARAAAPAPVPVPAELKQDVTQILRWFLKKQDTIDWFVEEWERRATDAPNPAACAAATDTANEYRVLATNNQRRLNALRTAYNAINMADYDDAMAEYEEADKTHKDHFVRVQRGIQTWDEVRQQPAPLTELVALRPSRNTVPRGRSPSTERSSVDGRRSPRKSMVRSGDL